MHILHGENIVQSRQKLFELMTAAKAKGTVIHLEAKNLDPATLLETLGSSSLFGGDQTIVIEELHSLPKSKRKEELIKVVAGQSNSTEAGLPQLILWEKRALTPTMLKPFKTAQIAKFDVTNTLFQWLDSLSGENAATIATTTQSKKLTFLQKAIKSDGEMLCLAMLARQLRLLLKVSDGNTDGLAPFIATKLKRQAATFTQPQLLKLHQRVLDLDFATKTGQAKLPLANQLELLTLGL